MSNYHQLVDIIIAGLIGGLVSFLISHIAISVSTTVGVALACMYYFSRHPWGSQHGDKYNEMIEDLFDEHLPFSL